MRIITLTLILIGILLGGCALVVKDGDSTEKTYGIKDDQAQDLLKSIRARQNELYPGK